MTAIEISIVHPGTTEIAICARWRVEEFAGVLGSSFEAERRTLDAFTGGQAHQVALIARRDGAPAGTCPLVPSEIDPVHSVSPWLAGLYVTPEHRRFGVGQALVRAIEAAAKDRGNARLYLYTDNAIGFYERLGWRVIDRVMWKGFHTALMLCDLQELT